MAKVRNMVKVFSQAFLFTMVLLNVASVNAMEPEQKKIEFYNSDGDLINLAPRYEEVLILTPKIAGMIKNEGSRIATEGIKLPASSQIIGKTCLLLRYYYKNNDMKGIQFEVEYLTFDEYRPAVLKFLGWLGVTKLQEIIMDIADNRKRREGI